jgi:hypothetical protein
MKHTSEKLLPFTLGNRFGYIDIDGKFIINKTKSGEKYLGENHWTEYDAMPQRIEIMNLAGGIEVNINDPRGYPILLDGRIFILGSDQNMLSEINSMGNTLWTYEFGAPITCIDAAAGLVLTGLIDGTVEIIDSEGRRDFFFEPGGSSYPVILGCAISRNGMRIAIISGIQSQRFLLLERYGNSGEYRVIYHEFLEGNFRKPVHVLFIDQDRRVVFEYPGGIGSYNIKSRQGLKIPLSGTIAAIDNSGDNGFLFVICSYSENQKELTGIQFPEDSLLSFSRNRQNVVFLKAPFKSNDVFLGRNDTMLFMGGGSTLISFELEKK